MALSAATAWEVRTTGSDTACSGGFVAGASGTDFSQQDAAQYSGVDLASSNGTNASPSVTSASHSFVAADVGNIIRITSGTNWTAGFYQIVSVSAGAATLDRAVGTSATLSSGSYCVGGAFASPGQAGAAHVASNAIHVKSGTYSITSASANVAGGCVSLTAGVSTAATRMIGYGSARNDNGTRPLLQASGIATFVLVSLANATRVDNVSVDGASLGGSRGFLVASGGWLNRSKAANCKNNGISGGSSISFVFFCETTGCSSAASCNGAGTYVGCVFHANNITGMGTGGGGIYIDCVSRGNTGASSHGFQTGFAAAAFINCTAYGNGASGFDVLNATADRSQFINCLSVGNASYGFGASVGAVVDSVSLVNCAGYNNTSGNVNANISAGNQVNFITLTGDPFTNAAGLDFSLNTTAGAGASLRAAGVPSASGLYALPGLSTPSYPDVGAVQRPDGPVGRVTGARSIGTY